MRITVQIQLGLVAAILVVPGGWPRTAGRRRQRRTSAGASSGHGAAPGVSSACR